MSKSVLRAAGAMGVATFLSRIMGLVREQVFAILFGAGMAMDAYNIAFRIPNLLRDLFAEGAMSASLVPTFIQTRQAKGERAAWRLAGLAFRTLFVGVSLIALVGILFAPQLVDLYASAYREVPGKFELTVSMTRILFFFFPLVALAAAFMGILNALGVFFLPAFASALFNLGSVLSGVLFVLIIGQNDWGIHPIQGMALGVVIGGAVQAFCQLPALYRKGYHWPGSAPSDPPFYQDPGLRRILTLMVPGTLGLAATQVNILVNSILATGEGTGAVSWLNYAFRLMQFPIGVFGVSLAAATLPTVSALWAEKRPQEVADSLTRSIRHVFAINFPAAAGLAFLGVPIVELIFQYGIFRERDTQATAMAIAAYAVGLWAYSGVKVLVPAFYGMGNTRIPVFSSVMSVGVNIGLNLWLVRSYSYWGLALGTSLTAILNFGFLAFAARRLIGKAGGRLSLGEWGISALLHLGIGLLMGMACFKTSPYLIDWIPDAWGPRPLVRLVRVGILITEGGCLVLFLGWALRAQDTLEVLEVFSKKVRKKLRQKGS